MPLRSAGDFTTAGTAQTVWLWSSQDAMKTSQEAECDQGQQSQNNSSPLPMALTTETWRPTAPGPGPV